MDKPRAGIIVGSNRRESINRRLAKALAKLAADRLDFGWIASIGLSLRARDAQLAPSGNLAALAGQSGPQPRQLGLVDGTRLQCRFHVDANETRQIVGLHLRDPVHIGANHRADHGIAAA